MITQRKIGSLSILLGLAIILYIMWQAGFSNIYKILTQITLSYVLAALIMDQLIIVLGTLRWMNFIKSAKAKVKFKTLYLVYLIGLAVNNITPVARLGGEPVRLYLLNRYAKIKNSVGFATMIASGFFDLGSFLLLNIFAILIVYFNLQLPLTFAYPLFFFVIIFSVLFLSLVHISINKKASFFITNWFLSKLKRHIKFLRKQVEKWSERVDEGVNHYVITIRKSLRSTLLLNLFITVVIRGLEVSRLYMVVLAVGEHISLGWVIVVIAFSVAVSLIPSPPGGFGVVESAMSAVFLLSGLALSSAITIVLIDRLIAIGFTSLLGFSCVHFLGMEKEIKKFRINSVENAR